MPDEIKSPSSPPPEGEPKPTADRPATPGGVKASPTGSVQSETKTTPDQSVDPQQKPAAQPLNDIPVPRIELGVRKGQRNMQAH